MFKIIAPGSYSFNEPQTQLVKRARSGLRGHDLSEFVKRASYSLVDAVRDVKVAPDEHLLHLIALGSTEKYSSNRNGDGFRAETCKKYHDTFVKHAKWYRNHANRPGCPYFGRVIASEFNDPMGRIELIVGLNGSEKTAKVNGGKVADKELKLLHAGKDLPVSMATSVPFDKCSGCGNQARTRAEYCDGPSCKYGGLKHNIARTFADGHTLHADNPIVCWRDISDVSDTRPADRIAYVLGKLDKAASGQALSGAELAELVGIDLPPIVSVQLSARVQQQVKLAYALATLEKQGDGLGAGWSEAFSSQVPLASWPAHHDRPEKLDELFRALAHEKVALPLRDFLALSLGDHNKAAAVAALVAPRLPGIYGRLVADGVETAAERNPYVSQGPVSSASSAWARKVAAQFSLEKSACQARVTSAAIRSPKWIDVNPVRPLQKQAATHFDSAAEALARQYALYKLAVLAAAPESDQDWLSRMAVRQDLVTAIS